MVEIGLLFVCFCFFAIVENNTEKRCRCSDGWLMGR